jgi:hypothetical protein
VPILAIIEFSVLAPPGSANYSNTPAPGTGLNHGETTMNVIRHKGLVICELPPAGGLLGAELSAPDLIGEAYEANPDIIAVPVTRLAPGFLDLSTRIAGEVFQKMEQYGQRLAVVGDVGEQAAASKALHDFVHETNRRGHHLFVPDQAALLARL